MIYDKIENFKEYVCINKHFIDEIKFLDSEPVSKRPEGRYEINDDGAYVVIEGYQAREASDCFIECHRKYIDVQFIIEGTESMGVCHKSGCEEFSYNAGKDFQKLGGDVDFLAFREGSFMVFFPEDAHMPGVKYDESPGLVKKAVFKIPV